MADTMKTWYGNQNMVTKVLIGILTVAVIAGTVWLSGIAVYHLGYWIGHNIG